VKPIGGCYVVIICSGLCTPQHTLAVALRNAVLAAQEVFALHGAAGFCTWGREGDRHDTCQPKQLHNVLQPQARIR
jgi:hypothetical protein